MTIQSLSLKSWPVVFTGEAKFDRLCVEAGRKKWSNLPISQRTVELAYAFGMRVLGVRRDPTLKMPGVEKLGGPDQLDELLPEAIALVRQLNKASTSLLQRRFRIGYTRAARMIDVMEEDGIIGPPTGTSKAREVLPWSGNAETD